MAQVPRNFPQHLEAQLRAVLLGRLRMAKTMVAQLLRTGARLDEALAIVEENMDEVEWDPDQFVTIGEAVDRWAVERVAQDLRPRLREPSVQATLANADKPQLQYMAEPADEIVVRKDATDEDVTINGTRFRSGADPTRMVLVDRSKLEERWRGSAGYLPPGRHNQLALTFGDQVDTNRPVLAARMNGPDDFRQGYKLRALSDRGFGVFPVRVPEEHAVAVREQLGATPLQRQAIRERAGQTTVDARSWALGIIGRGRSIERQFFADANAVVRVGQREGQSSRTVARQVTKHFGTAEARARFVARDRLGSLNASITRSKQTRLGFQFYRWQTAEDSRVRPEHAELNGVVRPWSTPHPTEGHPGEAPNCRCVAIPMTVDERDEQRRRNRAQAVAVTAIGVGAAAGLYFLGRRLRRLSREMYPTRTPRPVPKPIPLRPGEVIPLPAPVPMPQRMPAAARRQVAGAEVSERAAQALQFPTEGRRVLQGSIRARWKYAHQLTRRIRSAERAAGEPLSDYAATWWAAEKSIRQARSDPELAKRLAHLAGDRGEVLPVRRPRGRPAQRKRTGRRRRKS